MKALTILQPYAWLIAAGIKDIENRSWGTAYRGPLAVHTGKRLAVDEVEALLDEWVEAGVLEPGQRPTIEQLRGQLGRVVAVATLLDVVEDSDSPWAIKDAKHWVLGDVVRLSTPAEARGAQGLFELPDEVAAEVEARRRAARAADRIVRDYTPKAQTYGADDFQADLEALKAERIEALKRTAKQPPKPTPETKGKVVASVSPEELARSVVDVVRVTPDGPLLGAKWVVRVTIAAHRDLDELGRGRDVEARQVYDSAQVPGGTFDSEGDAREHASCWRTVQRERHERVAWLMAERRYSLAARELETMAAKALVDGEIKELRAASKQCAEDRDTLTDEAHAPEVGIFLVDDFVVVDAPSLTDGTVGRRWSGAQS